MTPVRSWLRAAARVLPFAALVAVSLLLIQSYRIVQAYPSEPGGEAVAYWILLALVVSALVYYCPMDARSRDGLRDRHRPWVACLPDCLRRWLPRMWAASVFLGAVLVWTLLNTRVDGVNATPDTDSYTGVGAQPLTSSEFWAGERPPTVPLALRIFGLSTEVLNNPSSFPHHARLFTQFQSILSLAAFILLGLAVASHVRHWWLKASGLSIVVATGMTIDVSQWNRMLISESLSISLLTLLVAVGLLALHAWRHWDRLSILLRVALALTLGVIAALYSFARDVNAFFLLALAIALALGLASQRVRSHPALRAYLALTVFLTGTFLLQYGLMGMSGRWVVPLANVLHERILPSQDGRSFLAAAGLPVQLLPEGILSNDCGSGCDDFHLMLMIDKGGRVFLDWIRLNGKGSYLRYLAAHPWRALTEPLQHVGQLLSGDTTDYRNRLYPDPASMVQLRDIFYPRVTAVILLWSLALLAWMAMMIFSRWPNLNALVPLFLLLSACPLIFVVWHGDAEEVARHAIQIGLQVRLALWMGTVFGLDFLCTRGLAHRQAVEPSDAAWARG